MAEEKSKTTKRNYRKSPEARIKEIDDQIVKLQAKKEDLIKPMQIKKIIDEASKKFTIEEIASRLEVNL